MDTYTNSTVQAALYRIGCYTCNTNQDATDHKNLFDRTLLRTRVRVAPRLVDAALEVSTGGDIRSPRFNEEDGILKKPRWTHWGLGIHDPYPEQDEPRFDTTVYRLASYLREHSGRTFQEMDTLRGIAGHSDDILILNAIDFLIVNDLLEPHDGGWRCDTFDSWEEIDEELGYIEPL